MKGYIHLMKLRMSNRVRLTVNWPSDYEDFDLPPLLFIPFIENAFKHDVSYQGNSFIEISMGQEKDLITFVARNSVSVLDAGGLQTASGIGLDNIRKRLALLYPGRHELRIEERDSVFGVELTIST